jgi:hypothetical protein
MDAFWLWIQAGIGGNIPPARSAFVEDVLV